MVSRTVSLVLITTIIACPVWCSNGLCNADQCCAAKASWHQACPVDGNVGSCCERSGSDSDCHRPGKTPHNPPCDSSCQGVCGGAIFEKPCELNNASDSFPSPLVVTDVAVVPRSAELCSDDIGHAVYCTSGGNLGRSLRTLYMSFLC